jgi:cell wall-associated NlpC family hydrolase
MRFALRLLILLALVSAFPMENRAAEESLGDKIKKIFEPTPTPTPRKHRKKSTTTKKKEPSPSPSSAKKKKPSPTPTPEASPSATPIETPEPTASASPKKKKSSPTPTPERSTSPSAKKHRKVSPTPSATETETPTPSAPRPPSATATPSPSPEQTAPKKGAPVSISANEIADYQNYSSGVRKIVDLALELASRGLNYKYGSADPASGGMDCSGFVFYVLNQAGVSDVPRDSSQQYVWLRKAYKFQPVISRHDDSFELDALAPGDLLFWTGTYAIDRDPPITHAMIYLGREKSTGRRIMIGASDGRLYRGESRFGVSVFDFKVSPPAKTNDGKLTPTFVGYGHVPGLR